MQHGLNNSLSIVISLISRNILKKESKTLKIKDKVNVAKAKDIILKLTMKEELIYSSLEVLTPYLE